MAYSPFGKIVRTIRTEQNGGVQVGRLRGRAPRWTPPARGDLVAAATVALVLIPQSLAYAELAGMPVVTGLYTAVTATIAAGLVGSSRYLQTGPVALTSLLTLGALTTVAEVGSEDYVGKAALLALVVGVLRVLLGLLRWGFVAYLMSQPVVASFTVAASLLILASQVPAFLDVPGDAASPVVAAGQALSGPGEWQPVAIAVGAAMVVVILLGRRWSPRFPGALVGGVGALLLSLAGVISITRISEAPSTIDGLVSILELTPNRRAIEATVPNPTSLPSWAATVLIE